jgi:hypothetical protein
MSDRPGNLKWHVEERQAIFEFLPVDRFEYPENLCCRIEPTLGVFLEHTMDQLLNFGRHIGTELLYGFGCGVEDRIHFCVLALSTESWYAGEHFVEDRSEAEDVAPSVESFISDLLWGHVKRCTYDGVGSSEPRVVISTNQTKIGDFDHGLGSMGKEDIGRLKVTMDPPEIMGRLDALQNLLGDSNESIDTEHSISGDELVERLAVDILHRDQWNWIDGDSVDFDDILMLDPAHSSGFFLQTPNRDSVVGLIRVQSLDGYDFIELRVGSLVNSCRAAEAD